MSPVTDMDVGRTPHVRTPASLDRTIKDNATVGVITYLGTGGLSDRRAQLTPDTTHVAARAIVLGACARCAMTMTLICVGFAS